MQDCIEFDKISPSIVVDPSLSVVCYVLTQRSNPADLEARGKISPTFHKPPGLTVIAGAHLKAEIVSIGNSNWVLRPFPVPSRIEAERAFNSVKGIRAFFDRDPHGVRFPRITLR